MNDAQSQRARRAASRLAGKCIACPADAVIGDYCEAHRRKINLRLRETMRRKRGSHGRNFGAQSYSYA